MNAIGMIETIGLIPAIEALDSMLKSASVTVVSKNTIGRGYVTVIVEGDVGSCRAAVDAGVSSGAKLGKIVSAHVIARPIEDTKMVLESVSYDTKKINVKKEIIEAVEVIEQVEVIEPDMKEVIIDVPKEVEDVETDKAKDSTYEDVLREKLEGKKLSVLKDFLHEKEDSLDENQIKYASKKMIIDWFIEKGWDIE